MWICSSCFSATLKNHQLFSYLQQNSWINYQVTTPVKRYFQHIWQRNTCYFLFHQDFHIFFFLLRKEKTQYASSNKICTILFFFQWLNKASISHSFLCFSISKSRLISRGREIFFTKKWVSSIGTEGPPTLQKFSKAFCHHFQTQILAKHFAAWDPCLPIFSMSCVKEKGTVGTRDPP